MKIKADLTKAEYDYLINNLLKHRDDILYRLYFISKISVSFDEELANEIRELAMNLVGFHFDENDEPTEIGRILDSLINKFYLIAEERVYLTKREYDCFKNNILKDHENIFSRLDFVGDTNLCLEKDLADHIRKLVEDEMGNHFDENRELTELGEILECLMYKLDFKTIVKIGLTQTEYDYLINNLLVGHDDILSKLDFVNDIHLYLEEDVADEIRKLAQTDIRRSSYRNNESAEIGWILKYL